MELFFYCTPQKLKELFIKIEETYPLIYRPFFGNPPLHIAEIDIPLQKPLNSCREFNDFGKGYATTPPFWIYTPDDISIESDMPMALIFSGPPVYLRDDNVLCEGSLYLSAENKAAMPRMLYKTVKHFFVQHFVKSGYCYIDPDVYSNRNQYLFLQCGYSSLHSSWCFDDSNKHDPIDIDTWYLQQGENMECYKSPKLGIEMFTSISDLTEILSELESKYVIKYVETVHRERTTYTLNVFRSAKTLKDTDNQNMNTHQIWVYDEVGRMYICLSIDSFYDNRKKIINVSRASEANNPFGDQLYMDFELAIKQNFFKLDMKHYDPFYLSPSIYNNRQNMILNLNDPRFRITDHDTIIPVWRKEWEQIQN